MRHRRIKKIIHGQEVLVTVYEEEKESPTLAAGTYMDELVNAGTERVEEIKMIKKKYQEDCMNVIVRENPDEGFLVLDEDDQMELDGYGEREDSYLPLDKQLEKLGIT
jgi:hypothetical protein